MNYATLEEAHGAPFGKRAPITSPSAPPADDALAKPEFTSLDQRARESIRKNKAYVDSVARTLPLDQNSSTETFVPTPQVRRMEVRERFTERPVSSTDEDKLARILRLIEQNRTGYERPAVEDMLLYVFTGVFFLFTLDTFVQLGKTMRKTR